MFVRSLVTSSRSVQTATHADAIDATCGLEADGAGAGAGQARGLAWGTMARGAGGGPNARGVGASGEAGGATGGVAARGVTTAGGRASRAVGASTLTVSGAARTLEAGIVFEESSSSQAIS